MTKEEIQAQISILCSLQGRIDEDTDEMLERRIEKLALKEESAKSIINLQEEAYNKGFTDMYIQCESTGLKIQKEAFEAGREIVHGWEAKINNIPEYNTFEDYIKSKTGGNM